MIAIPYVTALTTYFSYGLLFVFGQIRDLFRKILDWFRSNNLQVSCFFYLYFVMAFLVSASACVVNSSHLIVAFSMLKQGYAPICLGFEDFYKRRLYLRIQVLIVVVTV